MSDKEENVCAATIMQRQTKGSAFWTFITLLQSTVALRRTVLHENDVTMYIQQADLHYDILIIGKKSSLLK